jgi:hypothetical protein
MKQGADQVINAYISNALEDFHAHSGSPIVEQAGHVRVIDDTETPCPRPIRFWQNGAVDTLRLVVTVRTSV